MIMKNFRINLLDREVQAISYLRLNQEISNKSLYT